MKKRKNLTREVYIRKQFWLVDWSTETILAVRAGIRIAFSELKSYEFNLIMK